MAGALNYYQFLTVHAAKTDPNQIAALQERFRDAAAMFPPHARVAYLSDVAANEGGSALHGAAQYAIAPRVLDVALDGRDDWALGDFYQPYDAARIAQEHRLKVVRDLGNGVVVFRRQRP